MKFTLRPDRPLIRETKEGIQTGRAGEMDALVLVAVRPHSTLSPRRREEGGVCQRPLDSASRTYYMR
jgi:hypothetical protein